MLPALAIPDCTGIKGLRLIPATSNIDVINMVTCFYIAASVKMEATAGRQIVLQMESRTEYLAMVDIIIIIPAHTRFTSPPPHYVSHRQIGAIQVALRIA